MLFENETLLEDWKDAVIVSLYEYKGKGAKAE